MRPLTFRLIFCDLQTKTLESERLQQDTSPAVGPLPLIAIDSLQKARSSPNQVFGLLCLCLSSLSQWHAHRATPYTTLPDMIPSSRSFVTSFFLGSFATGMISASLISPRSLSLVLPSRSCSTLFPSTCTFARWLVSLPFDLCSHSRLAANCSLKSMHSSRLIFLS